MMSDAYEQFICAWDEMFLPLYVRPDNLLLPWTTRTSRASR